MIRHHPSHASLSVPDSNTATVSRTHRHSPAVGGRNPPIGRSTDSAAVGLLSVRSTQEVVMRCNMPAAAHHARTSLTGNGVAATRASDCQPVICAARGRLSRPSAGIKEIPDVIKSATAGYTLRLSPGRRFSWSRNAANKALFLNCTDKRFVYTA